VNELYLHIKGVVLEAEIESGCTISADRNQIMRMLNNLIQNAIQATKNEDDRKVIIRLQKKNNTYLIEVEDNGMGIPKELEDKIFKPNFTTKTKGMGLGLAIVQTIITNHHGDINYIKAKDRGTIFRVQLPFS
jgi:hypothetical protein